MANIKILTGDNIELLKSYPDNYFDSCITDAPYGLGKEPKPIKLLQGWIDHGYHEVKGKGFMGKSWDAFVPQPIFWKEVFRVLKPGGYLLSFFGTRTYDWGTLAIRLAGFEIRDCIQWIYGSGFPKSKAQLKPANEPICVARKPGALIPLNIDECRIDYINMADFNLSTSIRPNGESYSDKLFDNKKGGKIARGSTDGRYPSNVILDEETAMLLDDDTGNLNNSIRKQGSIRKGEDIFFKGKKAVPKESYNDFGGASRFFYIAKAGPSERQEGCEDLIKQASKKSGAGLYYNKIIRCSEHNGIIESGATVYSCGCKFEYSESESDTLVGNNHPTVKPISLIRHLQRLYTPKGGITLDPFAGSGTSGCSASFEDISEIVLMEAEKSYIPIIEARTKYWSVEKNRRNYLEGIKDKPVEEIKNQTKLFG